MSTISKVSLPDRRTRPGALWARWQSPTVVALATLTAGTTIVLDGAAQVVAPALLGLAASLLGLLRPDLVDDVVSGRGRRRRRR